MSEDTAQAKPSVPAEARLENEAGAAQPEKFDHRSHTISEEKRRELLRLFPEVRAEGEKVDFNRLKLALGESVDTGKERYGLVWPGKADCFKAIQAPSLGTLLPVPEESVNWDTTENLIIEGDNLEVLKLLQKAYLGKVKMIYIDPPYNTGNDFIYPDNYVESLQTYLEYTGQVDSQGKKFGTNTETDGRLHSKWLNMMFPRLYLARNLLRENGFLFVSISDDEIANLRHLCDQVFGEENLIEIFVWESTFRPSNMSRTTRKNAEYVLCYTKEVSHAPELIERLEDPQGEASLTQNNNKPRVLRFPSNYVEAGIGDGKYLPGKYDEIDLLDPLVVHKGKVAREFRISGRFKWSQEYLDDEIKNGVKLMIKTTSFIPYYRKDYQKTTLRPTKILPNDIVGDVLSANAELRETFGQDLYDYPKPTSLIRFFCNAIGCKKGDLILDFFAGSGTTGQAVLETAGLRFILVQLPERIDSASAAGRAGFHTIADITKERVQRVAKRLNTGAKSILSNGVGTDTDSPAGFRVYKLAESNFKVWDTARPEHPGALQRRLTDHVHHIREGRSDPDILTELLLKSGFPPTIGISEVSVGGKTAFKVSDGRLVVCLDRKLTLEAIRAIADLRPERVVCLDEGFEGNDQLKVNAAQTFKTKGVPSFQTV
jgi:adenine-specific DNA-methyltransferase